MKVSPFVHVFFLVPILIASSASGQTIFPFTRQDDATGDYLGGFLTATDPVGGISWSGPASSDVDTGTGDDAAGVYVSDPLSSAVHLNASRLIQFDLYVEGLMPPNGVDGKPGPENRGNTCYNHLQFRVSVELTAGERLVGGAHSSQQFQVPYSNIPGKVQFPPNPAGYGVCRFRFPAEVSVLDAGTVLTLRILHMPGSTAHAYGMAGDHGSVLRIPYFSEYELPFRFPREARAGPDSAPSASAAIEDAKTLFYSWSPLLLGSLFSSRPRRNARTVMMTLVVFSAGLAGCAAPDSAGPPASQIDDAVPRDTITPVYQSGNLSASGRGTLIGQVQAADFAQPVIGAYVLLLGTGHSTRTDAYGRYIFRDLQPAAYTIRADQAGYYAYEGVVQVVADVITRADLVLVPLEQAPGARPHPHDDWAGETRIQLMDEAPVGVGACSLIILNCRPQELFTIPAEEHGRSKVLAGTVEIVVNITWDPNRWTPTAGMQVWFQANDDPDPLNWTQLYARAPGKEFRIATAWEMTDPGHQRFSSWTFRVPTPGQGPALNDPQKFGTYAAEGAQYYASLWIVKGVVPLEPAHRTFWTTGPTQEVVPPTTRSATQRATQIPIWNVGGAGGYAPIGAWHQKWAPQSIVPPGAQWVQVTANLSRALLPTYDLELRYKTGEHQVPISCWEPEETGAIRCDGPTFQRIAPRAFEGNTVTFVIPVSESQADPYYAKRSFWMFALRPKDAPEATALSEADLNVHGSDPLLISLSAVARNDAMPA